MRNHVVLPAQRCQIPRIMPFTQREGLRVMKFLRRFFTGCDRALFAMFSGQHFLSASGYGTRFCHFQRFTNFHFFLGDFLLSFLKKLQQQIVQIQTFFLQLQQKEAICETLEDAKSRPVPARTKKVLAKEHGSKCSIATCKKPAQELHHTQTFALSKRHDPRYLAPLCREHHIIAHTINLRAREKRMRLL